MLFRQLFDRETSTYSYLIADLGIRDAVLVDPVLEQVDRDIRLLKELGLTLQYCLETHVHADHITGSSQLRDQLGCQSILPKGSPVHCANRFMAHGDVLQLGRLGIAAIATPGHTDSHLAFLVNGDRVLTGDSLLIRGCGRTDFQGGDAGELFDSVTERLFSLPDDTLVYPGHDYRGHTVSTIGEEKRWNPRFTNPDANDDKIRARTSFIELMGNLNLANPQKMAEAVPANKRCGKILATV